MYDMYLTFSQPNEFKFLGGALCCASIHRGEEGIIREREREGEVERLSRVRREEKRLKVLCVGGEHGELVTRHIRYTRMEDDVGESRGVVWNSGISTSSTLCVERANSTS